MSPQPGIRGGARSPRPEVLARLAEGVPSGNRRIVRSARARVVGIGICAVTAVAVLGAVVAVGYP
ncbi:MAG: hypothetical protein ACPHQB_07625 [Miltoncostaeaceae bacterium]